jgi:PIN domain nuclease of toxin-antitoxin system
MKLLLDTHAFLWFVWSHKNLSRTAQSLIANPLNEVFFSAASHWEIAIKTSTGKLVLNAPFKDLIEQSQAKNNFKPMPIEIVHSELVLGLPFHHRDPFDRMLIGQAMVGQMPIISADLLFDPYGVTRLW